MCSSGEWSGGGQNQALHIVLIKFVLPLGCTQDGVIFAISDSVDGCCSNIQLKRGPLRSSNFLYNFVATDGWQNC